MVPSYAHGVFNPWGPSFKPRAASAWRLPMRRFRQAVASSVRIRILVDPFGDLFNARVHLAGTRERLWELIERTRFGVVPSSLHVVDGFREGPHPLDGPGLDWLLVTSHPDRAAEMLPERWRGGLPPNVWFGARVENQEAADARIPHLLRVPARVRFLSLEPLLGPVNLRRIPLGDVTVNPLQRASVFAPHVHSLIIGGESGPKARPCDVAWIRDLRDQGREAGVPVFVKQLGALAVTGLAVTGRTRTDPATGRRQIALTATRVPIQHTNGGDPDEWPEDLRVRELPKVAA